VIQGTADATSKFTQQEFSKTVNFLTQAFLPPEHADAAEAAKAKAHYDSLAPEEKEALKALRTHHIQNVLDLEKFTTDVIDGRVPRLETGSLTLVVALA
jgi:flavine halogenase